MALVLIPRNHPVSLLANQIRTGEVGKGMDSRQEVAAQAEGAQPEQTREAKREATRVSHLRKGA